ncbi:UNVERIFIED_CONTAM: ABC-type uncharacterized transport system substrate-binding protein [Acetivibrio alkalicellulosi]
MNRVFTNIILVLSLLIVIGTIVPLLNNVTISNDENYISSINISSTLNDSGIKKDDGNKWKVGYLESESFIIFTETLVAIIRGFQELGWIEDSPQLNTILKHDDSRIIWNWLSSNDVSPYLEFDSSSFYNLKETDSTHIIQKYNAHNDLDFIIVMGTAAGNLLSNNLKNTNIFVFAASNAVSSGIIDSVEDSGKDNVWAHMDEYRFNRQISAFYDMFKFKKLGVVYEDSDIARIYSAINELESLSKEKNFTIIKQHVTEPLTSEEFLAYYENLKTAYEYLSQNVDAMYITIASIDSQRLPELLKPFYEKNIPVLSQLGSSEVENGALITVSVMDTINVGRFGAHTIVKSLQGVNLRDLDQSYQSTPKITLNSHVAKKINYKLPFELVIVIDEVY